MSRSLKRREFLKSASAIAAFSILPAGSRANSPSEKLRTCHTGVNGMGGSDLRSVSSHKSVEVAALCDVDANSLNAALKRHRGAKGFRDYREMISEMGSSVDAAVVSTPDHTHAPAAMTALKAGKPVYCQKPLTHEIFEARRLHEVATEKKLATQMGIQIHSHVIYRRAVQMIQSGVIGKVSQVHAWSSKNWGYDGGPFKSGQEAPANLDWNLWLGTTAMRPFVKGRYHRGQWRKIIDFGTGTLGDMGVHIFDTPYAALALTAPNKVKTTCRAPTGVGHPEKNVVEYEFPGTAYTTKTMLWKWYDGSFAPPKSEDVGLPKGTKLPGQASLFVGEGGQMLLPHIGEAKLFPQEKFKDFKRPDPGKQHHYHQWVEACMGNGKTSAGFDYAGPLTEALLLGVVANRFPGKELTWDAKKLVVTNNDAATKLVRREYRKGFEVEGL
jgi:predicted dehydrogenase